MFFFMLVDRCVLQDPKFIQKTLYFGQKEGTLKKHYYFRRITEDICCYLVQKSKVRKCAVCENF